MAVDIIRLLMERAAASGAKSTVLTDLRWYLAISSAGLLGSFGVGSPFWVSALFGFAVGVGVLIYLGAYCYFAVRSPDALRSERFTLSKMAIEKSLTGDNLSGLINLDETSKEIMEKGVSQ